MAFYGNANTHLRAIFVASALDDRRSGQRRQAAGVGEAARSTNTGRRALRKVSALYGLGIGPPDNILGPELCSRGTTAHGDAHRTPFPRRNAAEEFSI